jgi:Family of unknown function (DUF6283)
MTKIRSESCTACPYRRDVPSGVWAAKEYDKLADYDAPIGEQPVGAFMCHATPEVFCHGWAVVQDRQSNGHVLALRLDPPENDIPPEGVPLFSSGTEAAEHGKRDIENPSEEAKAIAQRLMGKYERLHWS